VCGGAKSIGRTISHFGENEAIAIAHNQVNLAQATMKVLLNESEAI